MAKDTQGLIDDARRRLADYTDDFSGDIGRRFRRVDARLERAAAAEETDERLEHLQKAQTDLNKVVNKCFTGVTPPNLEQYAEQPIERAVESVKQSA